MKAVVLAHCMWPGLGTVSGAETYTKGLTDHLESLGWDITVGVLGKKEQDLPGGIYVRKGGERCHDLVRDTDLVITYLAGTAWATKLAKRYDKPVVQTIHNTNQYVQAFLGTTKCDLAVYNSRWIQAFHEGSDSKKVRYSQKPPYVTVRPLAHQSFKGPVQAPGAITLVNLCPNKGPEILYALAEKNPHLDFVGVRGGYDVDKQVIRSLPNVTILPHGLDMDWVYSNTSVLLVPSIYESYGMVAMEAMAYGIPVLASNTKGLQECLGSIETYERTPEAFQGALDATLRNYDVRSSFARMRYQELVQQTESDLEAFERAIDGVMHGRIDRDPPTRSLSRL